jgi:hypothetical protein
MAGKKKPLWKSLTIQSAALLAVLVLARVFMPEQFSDELFQSLLAVLGFSGAVGLRRALPVLIVCCSLGFISNCGPTLCDKSLIEITAHPTLPSPPAGTITIKCCNDGECKDKATIESKEVIK